MGNPLQSLLGAGDPNQAMMGQATQAMNNPIAQPAPSPQGQIDSGVHPIIAKIIQALATGAQSYGWTGQSPQERLERTQMQQQKAETLARMAQTGAYQTGELGIRQQMADTAQQRAGTQAEDVKSKTESRDTANQIKQQMADLASEKNEWQKDMSAGRLAQAKQRISNQAAQFEQTFKLRSQQVGIEQAKLELAQQGMGIKQGFLDLANTALNQKGTAEGIDTITKLQGLAFEHPILSQVFGLDDVTKAVGQARGAGMPGTTPGGAAPGGPTAPLPAPPAPNIPTNKVSAKRSQKAAPAPAGGVTHVWTPQGIQPVSPTGGSQP
jgi:hypothetical protein